MDLKGKTVLVTGASRGIGKSISKKILSCGASVIGTNKSTSFPDFLLNHSHFEGISVDLSDLYRLKQALKPLFQRQKFPNILINNAGIFEDSDLRDDDALWLENLDRTLQINLKAPALLSKWAINRWVEEGKGLLINIASRAAYRGDTQEYASYAASKGGLVAFTKSIARDFGEYGVSAYTIAPGFVDTDMSRNSVKVYGEEYLTHDMAFNKITSPEEVSDLVAFLSTGKVQHMTGTTFHINGGSYLI